MYQLGLAQPNQHDDNTDRLDENADADSGQKQVLHFPEALVPVAHVRSWDRDHKVLSAYGRCELVSTPA